jgi:sugar lactone lactonase YvrE
MMTASAIITTVAGNGTPGYSGDGGLATRAQLNWPRDMAIGADRSLYIADTRNHCIRKVIPEGIISTAVGTGVPGYSGDGGPAASAQLNGPRDVEVGADGSLYIADTDNHCVRKVTPAGVIVTLAGTGASGYSGDGGLASRAQLAWPQDVAVGSDGNLYIADTGNHCIRKVTLDGVILTVAGTGVCGYGGDGGPAIRAQLARPRGVFVGADGCVTLSDTENHRVRRVTPDGTILTVVGNGTEGYSGDGGPAARTQLAWPRGVVVDADGCLFIADCGNSVIRKVAPDGTIGTVAGTGTEGYSGDGGPATRAELADPHGIILGSDGCLYIGEPRNHCIRKVWGVAGTAECHRR